MKHLRYFEALARLGHFGRAAESCAISQPALSVQIRELEELIGAPLVERGSRKIRLTSLGEEFVLVRPLEDAGKPVPSSEMLHEMRLLLLEEGHCFREQALSFCNIAAAPPRELMEGSSLTTLVQMVGAGIGVTLLPQMAVRTETRSADVSVFRLLEPRPFRTIGMIWRKTNPLVSQFGPIAEIVRDAGTRKKREFEDLPGVSEAPSSQLFMAD